MELRFRCCTALSASTSKRFSPKRGCAAAVRACRALWNGNCVSPYLRLDERRLRALPL
jgi:hypothetical protein